MEVDNVAKPIHAALTYAQNEELKRLNTQYAKNDVSQVLKTIQEFINNYQEYFTDGQINMFAIEAQPNLRNHTARTAFVMINLTGKTITEMNAHLEFKIDDFDLQFEPVDWEIPSDFLGSWAPNYAIMVVDDIPMQGQPTKASYLLDDIELSVTNVTVVNG